VSEPLAAKRIHDWPNYRRWSYGGVEYRQLEGISIGDEAGTLTFLFSLTWRDRIRLLFGCGIYVSVMAFKQPLQPLRVDVIEPEFVGEYRKYHDQIDEACT